MSPFEGEVHSSKLEARLLIHSSLGPSECGPTDILQGVPEFLCSQELPRVRIKCASVSQVFVDNILINKIPIFKKCYLINRDFCYDKKFQVTEANMITTISVCVWDPRLLLEDIVTVGILMFNNTLINPGISIFWIIWWPRSNYTYVISGLMSAFVWYHTMAVQRADVHCLMRCFFKWGPRQSLWEGVWV